MTNYGFSPMRPLSNTAFQPYATGMDRLTADTWDLYPEAAYDYWLSHMRPSQMDDESLRRMYNRQYATYQSRQIADPTGTTYPETNFMTYLSRLNPQYLVNRYSSASQGQSQRQYTRPARWIPS